MVGNSLVGLLAHRLIKPTDGYIDALPYRRCLVSEKIPYLEFILLFNSESMLHYIQQSS